jgi:transposase
MRKWKEQTMTKKKPPAYTREFQEKAVLLSKAPGNSVASVALMLGIPAWKLRNWVEASKQKLERSSEVNELIRLQNENKELREELEFLKKAAAYFAKTQQ